MEKYKYISFLDSYCDDKDFWVINEEFGGLFRIRKSDYTVKFVLPILFGKSKKKLGILKVKHYRNSIIFFPWGADQDIIAYNKINNSVKYISFPVEEKENLAFGDIIEINNKFYFIPENVSFPLISLEPGTWIFEKNYKWIKKMAAYKKVKWLYEGVVTIGNEAWFPISGTSQLIKMNLDTLEMHTHFFEICNKFGTIAYDGKLLWIAEINEYKVSSFDPINGIFKCYSYKLKKQISNNTAYGKIICIGSQVILLPKYDKKIMRVNMEKNEIEEIEGIPKNFTIFKNRNNQFIYWGYYIMKQNLLLFPSSGNMLLDIDLNSLNIKGYELIIDVDVIDQKLFETYYTEEKHTIIENSDNSVYSLECLCSILPPEVKQIEDLKEVSKNGEFIFQNIKYNDLIS